MFQGESFLNPIEAFDERVARKHTKDDECLKLYPGNSQFISLVFESFGGAHVEVRQFLFGMLKFADHNPPSPPPALTPPIQPGPL
jgi:hypothetical protein